MAKGNYHRHKYPKLATFSRKITKLFLNLVILTGLGMLIWHGYFLFTHKTEPLINSIILIAGIVAWILLIRLLRSRYKWIKPSFKLTTFSVVAIALILTFAGVQPLAGYKDNLVESYRDIQAERAAQVEEEEATIVAPVLPSLPELPRETTLRNPSWEELKVFLWEDKTDQLIYIVPTFVCHDFAKALQANAKEAGWRCAYVGVELSGGPDLRSYGIPLDAGHALNAFETTDRGLVYIDCTSSPGFSGNSDKVVDIKVGEDYILRHIFPTPGWPSVWESDSVGRVEGIGVVQW